MTKKHLIFLALLPFLFCIGCSKDRNCRCVTTETEQETIINADRGMKCAKITRLGTERQSEGHLLRSYEEVKCEEI